jgi:photosystem II stability/assembly factor-like uncharacterized protein
VPITLPERPRVDEPEIDELLDELRALIEEARRRARRRRLFVTAVFIAVVGAGAIAFLHGGGSDATLGRSEADAARSGATTNASGAWRNSHGPDGVYAASLASAPGALYAGTIWSGIYKRTARGHSWRAVDSGLIPALRVDALAVDPFDARTVYAGTGDGFFRSTNAGRTWQRSNRGFKLEADRRHRLTEGAIWQITTDPFRRGTIYAGSFKSTDGGRSWRRVPLPGHARGDEWAFARSDPAVVVAAGRDVYATRLFTSRDGGRTWTTLRIRPRNFGFSNNIAIDPHDAHTLYLARGGLGLLKSVDLGQTWIRLRGPQGGVGAYALDPFVPGRIYVASLKRRLFRSNDAGVTWRRLPLSFGHTEWVAALLVDEHARDTLWVATSGRILVSTDGGATWATASKGLHASVVAALAARGDALYAVTADGVSRSRNNGRSWRRLPLRHAGVTAITGDPQLRHTLYAAAPSTVFRSDDNGNTWQPLKSGLPAGAIRSIVALERDGDVVLYAGTWRGVYASVDRGRSWRFAGVASKIDSLAAAGNTIYAGTDSSAVFRLDTSGDWIRRGHFCCWQLRALAVDPAHPDVAYGGNAQGVWKSTDAGVHWRQVGLAGLRVQTLAIDPSEHNRIYAGSWSEDGSAGGVQISNDGGATWNALNHNLPGGGVMALTFSADRQWLYAGTYGHGVVSMRVAR